jgi:hypothetical protein
MLAALLVATLAYQEPAPQKPAQDPPAAGADAKPAARLQPLDDKDAKAAVDAFGKAMKAATSIAAKSRALDDLVKGSNKLLVRPLATVVQDDASVVVRKRATELLAQQPASEAVPAIVKLLANGKVQQHAPLLADLVHALQTLGWDGKHWKRLESLFEQDYTVERAVMQEAILDLVIACKEKQATELLLRNLDEPVPSDVEGAANPPASYWEGRWKAWKSWREKVKNALFVLTGQHFSAAAEARAWLKKNGSR